LNYLDISIGVQTIERHSSIAASVQVTTIQIICLIAAHQITERASATEATDVGTVLTSGESEKITFLLNR